MITVVFLNINSINLSIHKDRDDSRFYIEYTSFFYSVYATTFDQENILDTLFEIIRKELDSKIIN